MSQGGNYWTLFTPGIWKVLHAVLQIKLTVELSAAIHRDLVAYADALSHETGQDAIDPAKLVAPMLARFIAGDRAFAKLRSVRKPNSARQAPADRTPASEQG